MVKHILYFVILISGIALAQFEPKAVIKPTEYDFGDIKEGAMAEYSFTVTNDGNDELVIKNVKGSCGCTAAKPSKTELKPGESTKILVSFNSSGRAGKQSKSVSVETNDPQNPFLKFSFTGNVVSADNSVSKEKGPHLNFKETIHDFGKVKQGKAPAYTFKFTNSGNSTLEIKEVSSSGDFTADLISSKRIEPGKEGTLKVELDTKKQSGKLTRNITIKSNDPDEPSKTITVSAEIIKEG